MHQSRNTLAGSVRIARQAGKKQAVAEVIVIAANADTNAIGSLGLTQNCQKRKARIAAQLSNPIAQILN
jgi:hypothetical protein